MNVMFININQLSLKHSPDTIPLNAGYISAYLIANGHNAIIVDDVKDVPLTLKRLDKFISEFKPGIIGFSAYHYQMERIRYFARFIKKFYPDIKVVLGGPQALFLPAEALDDLVDFDVICNRGEGEITLLSLAEALECGKDFSDIKGIIYKKDGQSVLNPAPLSLPEDLDIYPSPYITGVINLKGKTMASIFTSRGCEHVCNFCVTPFFNKRKIRFHSIDHVLEDMAYLEKIGMENIWIGDPNFTAYRDRTEELMKEKIRRGIKIPFWCQTRVDMVDEDLLTLMKEAGLYCVGFGLEAGSDKVLEIMHKGVEVDKFHKMVSFAQSIGIDVELFSMYGQPGETIEDAKKTIEIVRKYNIPIYANSYAQRLQVTAGSLYGTKPEKYGFKIYNNYRPRYLSVWNDYDTNTLSSKDFDKIHALWTLYNAEIELNLKNRVNIFHAIDFILSYKDDLKKEKRFYEIGVYLASLLENEELLNSFIDGFTKEISSDKSAIFDLLSHLEVYEETDAPVDENSRVIIYCEYDKQPDVISLPVQPGLNDLRYDVAKDLIKGMKKGDATVIPASIGLPANCKVQVLNVYKRKKVKTLKELKNTKISHNYNFIHLKMLEHSQNELILFLYLKSMPIESLVEMPGVFLNLISFYAKMHKFKNIEKAYNILCRHFPEREKAAESIGDIIGFAGKYDEALKYYDKAGTNDNIFLKKANALVMCKRYEDAYDILKNMGEKPYFYYKKVLCDCLKYLKPDETQLIQILDFELIDMFVESGLQNEQEMGTPVVHGDMHAKA
jgi:radical SAM superfamily enzyme YgiQ (UPF0313 family)